MCADAERRSRTGRAGHMRPRCRHRLRGRAFAALDPRRQQPVLLERAGERLVDPGPFAELAEIELGLALAETRGVGRACGPRRRPSPAPCRLRAAAGTRPAAGAGSSPARPDVFAEEPVAAARPLGRQQALILEVADLRDRDVREELETSADRADRVQTLLLRLSALCGCCRHRLRKVSLYLPIPDLRRSSSSLADSIRHSRRCR